MTHPNSHPSTEGQHDTNGGTPTDTPPANPLVSYIAGLLSPSAPKVERP